jgi:hypothetical protein
MEPYALTLFVLFACGGMLTIALLARWLRGQSGTVPDIELETAPGESVLASSTAAEPRRTAAAAGRAQRAPVTDDEATQPMTRTETSWGGTDWPSTQPFASSQPAVVAPGVDETPRTASSDFADTLPMPVETTASR